MHARVQQSALKPVSTAFRVSLCRQYVNNNMNVTRSNLNVSQKDCLAGHIDIHNSGFGMFHFIVSRVDWGRTTDILTAVGTHIRTVDHTSCAGHAANKPKACAVRCGYTHTENHASWRHVPQQI